MAIATVRARALRALQPLRRARLTRGNIGGSHIPGNRIGETVRDSNSRIQRSRFSSMA